MGKEARRLLSALMVISVTLVQCGPKGHDSDGGQHTGGGNVLTSSEDQVNAALDLAISLASEPDPKKNIFFQMWHSNMYSTKWEEVPHSTNLFPQKFRSVLPVDPLFLPSAVLSALSRNKITRLASGDCLRDGAKHADASVSAFNEHAQICFSVGNLRRVPPSVLLREISSLVLHEAAHLSGADEVEAIRWQQMFSKYFGARIGDISKEKVVEQTAKSIAEVRSLLNLATDHARFTTEKYQSPRVPDSVGRIREILKQLPYAGDSVALSIQLKPKNLDFVEAYIAAVGAGIKKAESFFWVQPLILSPGQVRTPKVPTPQFLLELTQSVDLLESTFKQLSGAEATAP